MLLGGCDKKSTSPVETAALPGPQSRNFSGYYPPTETGMRGSHEGSYEVAHALSWRGQKPSAYRALDEHYDLAVVGAGMSGLAAAHFFQKKMGPDARILILDNHDDFGGHAKRNEFHQDGRMMVSLGGAQNIEWLSYGDEATQLMSDIGLNEDFLDLMSERTAADLALAGNLEANNGVALPGEAGHIMVSGNWNNVMFGADGYDDVIASLPLPEDEKRKLTAFWGGKQDFLDELSMSEKWDYINSVSYNQYLVDKVGLLPSTLPILNAIILHLSGMSGWNLTVGEAILGGGSGIKSMGWFGKATAKIGGAFLDSLLYTRMFPDGNASVARLLVRHLIPEAAPEATGPENIVAARFNYDALDRENHRVRLRLNSTVVGVRELPSSRVEVDYVERGEAKRVTASHCIMACYNGLIPDICPEMPEIAKRGSAVWRQNPICLRQRATS